MKKKNNRHRLTIASALAIIFIYNINLSFSQSIKASTYVFNTSSGATLYSMAGADTIAGPGNDSIPSLTYLMGNDFAFYFAGKAYTTFSADPDGWMKLGGGGEPQTDHDLSDTINGPVIAPYWGNLLTDTSTGYVTYKLIGAKPNRALIVQWVANMYFGYNTQPVTFQAWLHESTGRIDFVYDTIPAVYNRPFSIGISSLIHDTLNFASVYGYYFNNSMSVSYSGAYKNNQTWMPQGGKISFIPAYIQPSPPGNVKFGNIYAKSVNINFIDSSNTETYFDVQMSTDSINFQEAASVVSTTTKGKGKTYSAQIKYLTPNTKYYFKVTANTEGGGPSAPKYLTVTTPYPSLKGILKIPGDFFSISSALAAIRDQGLDSAVILQLQSNYTDTKETFPILFDSNLITSNLNTITLQPAPGVSGLIIHNRDTGYTVVFDLAKNITLDGRPGGTDTLKGITFTNDSNYYATIAFINGSTNDTVRSCVIRGKVNSYHYYPYFSHSSMGEVYFGASLQPSGNSYNALLYNDIREAITGFSEGAVYSAGNSTNPNMDNLLEGNNIFNFAATSYLGSSNGIYINGGNTDWTIIGNSFYDTAKLNAYNSGNCININNIEGENFIVNNNYFGGNKPHCGGSPMLSVSLDIISLTVKNGGKTSQVNGNIIHNLHLNNCVSIFAGGNVEINNNIIGGQDTLHDLVSDDFYAIIAGGDNCEIEGNKIGGIIAGYSYQDGQFVAISGSGANVNIINNLIGSKTAQASIVNRFYYGCAAIEGTTSNLLTIKGNTIANISISSEAWYSIYNQLTGIWVTYYSSPTGETAIIDSNNIYNLTSAGINSVAVAGIYSANSTENMQITNNTIYGLVDTNTIVNAGNYYTNMEVDGISIASGATTGSCVIDHNLVHSLKVNSKGDFLDLNGISATFPNLTVTNNIVRLGMDTIGDTCRYGTEYFGITCSKKSRLKIMFNTVFIGGDSTYYNSEGFIPVVVNSAVAGDTITDNIFEEVRTIASSRYYTTHEGTMAEYGIGSTAPFIDRNVYYCSDGVTYFTPTFTFKEWQTTYGIDGSSVFMNPKLKNPLGSTETMDMHYKDSSICEGNGIGVPDITTDYFHNLRSAYSPVDIGAVACLAKKNSLHIFPPVISLADTILNTSYLGNQVLQNVNIMDTDTLIDTTNGNTPRIWYRRLSPTTSKWASQPGNFVSGNMYNGQWKFTINYSLASISPAANNVIQYYIVAQDKAGNIGYNPAAGASHTSVNKQVSAPGHPHYYTIKPSLQGTIKVGKGQKFFSLTNKGGFFEHADSTILSGNVTVLITSNLNESGTYQLNNLPQDTPGGFSITISPDSGVVRKIQTNQWFEAMIRFYGAQNIIIDGRYHGSGHYLDFRSLGEYGTTFELSNNVNNLMLRNCVVETAEKGNNLQLMDAYNTGNNNIKIYNNIFRDRSDSSGMPTYEIYAGSSNTNNNSINNQIEIIGNEFGNFITSGIYIDNLATGNYWKIDSNSFYCDSFRYPVSNTCINFQPGQESNFNEINDNSIGGQKAGCMGPPYLNKFIAHPGYYGYYYDFTGIYINDSSLSPISINRNIIRNINWFTEGGFNYSQYSIPIDFAGIYIAKGKAILEKDTIGTASDSGNIKVHIVGGNGSANIYGIANTGRDSFTVDSGAIGSISVMSTSSYVASTLFGLCSYSGYNIFTNNLLGSKNSPYSLAVNTTNLYKNYYPQRVAGIYNQSAPGSTISGNEAANILSLSPVNDLDYTAGIITTGKCNINQNKIHDLYAPTRRSKGNLFPSVMGIGILPGSVNDSVYIEKNEIYGISNLNFTTSTTLAGIFVNNASEYQRISSNSINSIFLSNSPDSASIKGISDIQGNSLIDNNMIRLGLDTSGNSITQPAMITGIDVEAGGNKKIFFNSIYIGGTNVNSGIFLTTAMMDNNNGNDSLVDNIFQNSRSNNAGAATHNAIIIQNISNVTLKSNIYYANGNGGNGGIVNNTSLYTIKLPLGINRIDSFPIMFDPAYKNANGNHITGDLHVSDTSVTVGNGKAVFGIPYDFDGKLRTLYTQVDIGADATSGVSPDTSLPVILYTPLADQFTNSSISISAKVLSGFGIPDSGGLVPELYYKQGNNGNYLSVKGAMLKGNAYNSNWNFQFIPPSGGFKYGDTVFYFITAQDARAIPHIVANPSKSFSADSVNHILIFTSNPYSFKIIDTTGVQITFTPLTNTYTRGSRNLGAGIASKSSIQGGGLSPLTYYKKGINGKYTTAVGNLISGNYVSGNWDFNFNPAIMGGWQYGDTIFYFVIAQDSNKHIAAEPSGGFSAITVDSIINFPVKPDFFIVRDSVPPNIYFSPLNDTVYAGTRSFIAQISDSLSIDTGVYAPRAYFHKNHNGGYTSIAGKLIAGSAFNGSWQFTLDTVLVNGLAPYDTVYYYVVAQDGANPVNIGFYPGNGRASNVDTVLNEPSYVFRYAVLDSTSPIISCSSLPDTTYISDRIFYLGITSATGISTTGKNVPRTYFRRKSMQIWKSYPAILYSGTGRNGIWQFEIKGDSMPSLAFGDTIQYFVIAQDDSGRVVSCPYGASAKNINSLSAAPQYPLSYRIYDSINISCMPLPDTDAIADRDLFVSIQSVNNIPVTGATIPQIYYKLASDTTWNHAGGSLDTGTQKNGSWKFIISKSAIPALHIGDIINYFVLVQDEASLVASYPSGAQANNVNFLLAAPQKPLSYKIYDSMSINCIPLPDTDAIADRNVFASIWSLNNIPATGTGIPQIYYKLASDTTWNHAGGSLDTGTQKDGRWKFIISKSALPGLHIGDIINYFVLVQDEASLVASYPSGAQASNVNFLLAAPQKPLSYKIYDSMSINCIPLPDTDAIADRNVFASIRSLNNIPATGTGIPQIYYKQVSDTTWNHAGGSLDTGTQKDGRWKFIISKSTLRGLYYGDTIDYFILVQDEAALIASCPEGVMANNVDSLISPPKIINTYHILDTVSPVITFNPLTDTLIHTSRILHVNISDSQSGIQFMMAPPELYLKKSKYGSYFSIKGNLEAGTRFNSTWDFDINYIKTGALNAGDTIYYFVIAQDSARPANVGSYPEGVKATSVNNISRYPDSAFFYVILTSTGIEPQALKAGETNIKAFPDPFGNEITLSVFMPQNGPMLISLTDITGKKIFEELTEGDKGMNTLKISGLGGLRQGVYFLKFITGTTIQNLPIVKINSGE